MSNLKARYEIFSALLSSGIDSELDRFVNEKRAGKTAPLAGYRYSVPKEARSIVESNGRRFGRLSDERTAELREKFGSDPIVAAELAETIRRFTEAFPDLAPEVLAAVTGRFDEAATTVRRRKAIAG